ncbi:hypothetical protein C6497_04130 [Candidatus Poribacteria bacterium]|nr:MAG: hypothetical protein C6497_04130 [Candidatus Poribacteria bacterium]
MLQRTITNSLLFLLLTVAITVYAQENTQGELPEDAITRLGKGGINLMQFSPDGSFLVVGTDVGVWVYDTDTGNAKELSSDEPAHINALAFSPDGKILATGGFSNPIIQLWELDTGKKLNNFRFKSETGSVVGLAFTEDGNKLIIFDKFGELRHWQIQTNRIVFNTHSVSNNFQAIAYSKRHNIFATGQEIGSIHVFDASSGKRQKGLIGHSSLLKRDDKDIWSLAFSSDGSKLASGSMDKTVRLWDVVNRKHIARFSGHQSWITALALSSDGSILASGDANKRIILWDTQSKEKRVELEGHTSGIPSLVFSPDGTILASASYDGSIRFWNPNTGKEISIFATGHTKWITSLAFSKNDKILTSVDFNGTVDLWNMKTKQGHSYLNIGQIITDNLSAISHDGILYAAMGINYTTAFYPLGFGRRGGGSRRGTKFQVWNLSTGEELHGPWTDQNYYVNAVTFSPDNKMLVISDRSKGILSWNIETREETVLINQRFPFKKRLTFSPNGKMVASHGTHGTTHIWNYETHKDITPEYLKKRSSALSFSTNNMILGIVHRDKIVLWDIKGNELKERGSIKSVNIEEITFSPYGKYLITANLHGWKYYIKVWDIETGNELLKLKSHTEKITVLRFSHDGKILASGSLDGTILLWDWEKITKRLLIKRVENLSINLIPPVILPKYDSKEAEAAAVKFWLKEKGYTLEITPNRFSLNNAKGKVLSLNSAGGRLSIDDVEVIVNNDYFTIKVYQIGTGTFIHEDGEIKYFEIEDGKNTQ